MRVAICGAGVIGAAIAYYLSRRGAEVIVFERCGVACAASGKAGGFLALDWCRGSPLDRLARRSFLLHATLPGEIGADWGYRRLTTYSGFAIGDGHGAGRESTRLTWLSDCVMLAGRIGSPETTALVHPGAFTAAMMRAAQDRGAVLRLAQVTGVARTQDGAAATGVTVAEETIAADAVVIAMGPWSVVAAGWVPLPPVFAYKGHSVLFHTGRDIPADALFLEYQEAGGDVLTPELFPRADGTTYVSAMSHHARLPPDPADVMPDAGAIGRIETMCARLSPLLQTDKIIARQACCRPTTSDGLPLIGRIPGVRHGYVATGHGVWGILNAPATGEAMAELILDDAAQSSDLTPFDPARLQ